MRRFLSDPVSSMDNQTPRAAPLPELLRSSAEAFEISTEVSDADRLLTGEAARHFPEPRNRRREDAEDERFLRLKTALSDLRRGTRSSAETDDDLQPPVHSQFYKQF